MTRIGSARRRAKVNSTSASYRAKVRLCGRSAPSTAESRICCTRMMLVTAAMVRAGPIRASHSCAARAIGSNGRGPRRTMGGDASSAGCDSGPGRAVSAVDDANAERGRGRPRRCGRVAAMLFAFSVAPAGGGSDSVGDAVADAIRVVRESGLPNETTSMFTTIEAETWDEGMAVVKRAVEAVQARAPRVSLVLKADIRPGHTGQLMAKVQRVEQALGDG